MLGCGWPPMMQLDGLVETALYVADPLRSERFYREVLGLELIAGDPRIVAMRVKAGQVLLLIQKGGSMEPIETPGGLIPPDDSSGRMHIAFSVSEEALDRCETQLLKRGVEIEGAADMGGLQRPGVGGGDRP